MTLFISQICKSRVRLFYAAVLSFALICTVQLYSILKLNQTKLRKPGPQLTIQPVENATFKTVFIRYDENEIATVEKWINLLDKYMEMYNIDYAELNTRIADKCDFAHPPRANEICPVNLEMFGPCVPPYYGYYSFSPCVFLSLSKVLTWVPECYNVIRDLPSSMPKDLVQHIKQASALNKSKQVWVSCSGVDQTDKEHVQQFNYYPSRGFPSYFYPIPYKLETYFSPVVAVEIVNPTPGVFINIECRAWANNINIEGDTPEHRNGLVQFSLMRDELSDPQEENENEKQWQ